MSIPDINGVRLYGTQGNIYPRDPFAPNLRLSDRRISAFKTSWKIPKILKLIFC